MSSFLITLPKYDEATGYLFEYSKEIIETAKKKGKNALQLSRPRLTRHNFESLVSKQNPKLFLFNAHGDNNTIYGDKLRNEEEPLVRKGLNHFLLRGRLVYARACCAAAGLGKAVADEGGCFIGYAAPFSFLTDERRSATPLKDKTAGMFLAPSNALAVSLVEGHSGQEAAGKFIALSKENIFELLKTRGEPEALVSAMVLWNNIQGQLICGDGSMKWA